ncbi:MAG: hypothetical protein RIE08_17160 [Acidimicrobiales bacterium]
MEAEARSDGHGDGIDDDTARWAPSGPSAEEIELIVDGDLPTLRARRRGGSGSVLAAAMLAVGEIIEPEKTTVEVEQEAGDPDDALDGIRLDFGDLPPLN